MIQCNGYFIRYNPSYKMWHITTENITGHIAAPVAEFKSLKDALDYCKAG